MDPIHLEPPPYEHIERNEFLYRKHKKQKDEDIAVCDCKYEPDDPESACGEDCLNFLTSTECTPGYCPCGDYCRNQRFQKCEYVKTRLVKTEGRGWGLLADEDVKAGQFVIEYCGEVISWKQAKKRAQTYEAEGLKDAYIISLNASESIDATCKGSLARFINHSCQPNCETRKWTVLGELRVGIFARQDIAVGTELSYDYNFEWYGGHVARCLCGAQCCSGFLGAKSRGFQEASYLWEDDDDRFSVENVPIYDSADDESAGLSKAIVLSKADEVNDTGTTEHLSSADSPQLMDPISVEPLNFIPMEAEYSNNKSRHDHGFYTNTPEQKISDWDGNKSHANSATPKSLAVKKGPSKCSPHYPFGKSKANARKQIDVSLVCEWLASTEARQEILACEELKTEAASRIETLYDEIRPAVEEHERDSQDSVSTSLAEKWIEATCSKYKADFNFYSALIRNLALTPMRAKEGPRDYGGIKLLNSQ